jgi:hypothetical protein
VLVSFFRLRTSDDHENLDVFGFDVRCVDNCLVDNVHRRADSCPVDDHLVDGRLDNVRRIDSCPVVGLLVGSHLFDSCLDNIRHGDNCLADTAPEVIDFDDVVGNCRTRVADFHL